MAFGSLFRRAPKPDPALVAALKDKLRTRLNLPEDAALTVNEIVCADPACPGTETVILVMVPKRKTLAYKVAAPLTDITDEALDAAIAAAVQG